MTDIWIGLQYRDGQWIWDNQTTATNSSLFHPFFFDEQPDDTHNCAKARITGENGERKLTISQQACDTLLPTFCQFSEYKLHYWTF